MIKAIKKTNLDVLNDLKNDTNLKGNEYRIYELLVSMAAVKENKDRLPAECFTNLESISRVTGAHSDTVRRVLKKLEAKGYILIQRRKHQYNNSNISNMFTICAMLTDEALELKKLYIEKHPVIKDKVDNVNELVAKIIEEQMATVEDFTEETTEEVPNTTVTAETTNTNNQYVDVYEQLRLRVREENRLENLERDKDLIKVARNYGITLNLQQARSLHNRYCSVDIESAFVRSEVAGITTYEYVMDILHKQQEKKAERMKYFKLNEGIV
ncbi:helix-turn-helix domain-containing protein [Terrisporobacter sp.]|uniref:helix-turn-helix domain-containing protein n=1 Tax=Terrisporobacter sp. TaxID=1965305 RepID=UPI003992868C